MVAPVTVYKVQRPLDDPDGQWLIYAKGHTGMSVVDPVDLDPLVVAAMGQDFKAYFEGEIVGESHLHLSRRVPDQRW